MPSQYENKYEEENLLLQEGETVSARESSDPMRESLVMQEAENEELVQQICKWHAEAAQLRMQYDQRWAKNLKLVKGIFDEEETSKSRVRNRSKLFFRKTWATVWRITASLYTAFLRDPDTFRIDGRGSEDVDKAFVLQKMVEYRRDDMFRRKSQFLKFIWAFLDILMIGIAVGKWRWIYNPNTGKDEPDFVLYAPEQVYMDLSAETKEDMRYVIFENYMTKDEMVELGYGNLEEVKFETPSSNPLRNARYRNQTDPLQNPKKDEYPSPGSYEDGRTDSFKGGRGKVWEVFYMKDGEIKFCVAAPSAKKLLKPVVSSPYGERYPLTFGTCLTEPHKLIGEGWPEILEGPQESYNSNLNMRKDNVALSLNKMSVVSRFANVDLQSLTNSRPGGIVLTDDVGAVVPINHGDVTQSSYNEAAADDMMMQEMSGVTPSKQGMGSESKATVAQINYSEGNAKIDLFMAIIGETFMKDWYDMLTYLIQRFETNEKVFRVANSALQKDAMLQKRDISGVVNIVDDFSADCILNVGAGTVGRQMEIQQTLLAMDRAVMANQSMLGIMQTGIIDPTGIRFFDATKFMEKLLPKLGYKNSESYFMTVIGMGGMQLPAGAGGMPANVQGAMQPQIGSMNKPIPVNPIGV